MSAHYPPTAAATEASRILDMGRQRAPSPTLTRTMSRADIKEFRLLFGDATLDPLGSPDARLLSRALNSVFQEEALRSPWSVGAPMDQPEMISGPPTLSRLWVGVTSPSLAASIALERSLWINQLHHPCVQKTSVFAYLVMKFAGPAQDNCGRAVCLPSQRARSALVYLASTDLDSVEEGAPAKRRRISSVGVITDEVQKRLLERLSKGYLGAYLWESGIRGQDVENCLKAERRSGVAVLAISALQNCMRVYESLKIDEVRAMRQHFPMNLHGKQIGHVLGSFPGALYGQAVLQGMSRAYQGVLEEANRKIVEFRLRATMPATTLGRRSLY